jgi:hypothetical protein
MRGWVFANDGASLHRAKERKEALIVIFATVSGPCNRLGLNVSEQLYGMRKGAINREECSTPEELSFEADPALGPITISSVNWMVESYSTRLCVILASRELCPQPWRRGRIAVPCVSNSFVSGMIWEHFRTKTSQSKGDGSALM